MCFEKTFGFRVVSLLVIIQGIQCKMIAQIADDL